MDGELGVDGRQPLALLLLDLPLHRRHQFLGVLAAAVDELPARALRDVPPDQQDDQAEDDAEGEAEPPAEVLGEDVGVQHHDGQQGAADRAEPVAAVDDQVDPAAVLGGDQLVDRGVDGRVLAADAEAGEEAEEEEPPGLEGEGGQRRGRQVDGERHHEQLLAAVAVGEPAEEEGAGTGARHVQSGGDTGDLGGGDGQAAAVLGEAAGDVADDGDFQTVQDPDGAEADHDHPVPARPRQAVEPGRYGRGDGALGPGGGASGPPCGGFGHGLPPRLDGRTPTVFPRNAWLRRRCAPVGGYRAGADDGHRASRRQAPPSAWETA